MVRIYGLVCPLSGEIRYIGKTNRSLGVRLRGHLSESLNRRSSHKHRWIARCFGLGLRPTVWLLEEIEDGKNWQERERAWIKRARDMGLDLTNQTHGGEGLDFIDPEAKAKYLEKLSAASKKAYEEKPHIKAALVAANKRSWAEDREGRRAACLSGWTEESKKRHTESMAAVRQSPEFKEAKSRASKKAWENNRESLLSVRKDPVTRAKQSERKKKSWQDPEVRQRMANRWTPEAKAKQAAEILSRKEKIQAAMTPEVRARQAAKLRETWAKRKAAKA